MKRNPLVPLIVVITFVLLFCGGALLSPYMDPIIVKIFAATSVLGLTLGLLGYFSTRNKSVPTDPSLESLGFKSLKEMADATNELVLKLDEERDNVARLEQEKRHLETTLNTERHLRRRLIEDSLKKSDGYTRAGGGSPNRIGNKVKPSPPKTIYDHIIEEE